MQKNMCIVFKQEKLLLLSLLVLSCTAAKNETAYRSPLKFEKDIQKFEAMDKKSMPPQGAVVVTGSSSVRMWHSRIKKDLKGITVIPRGFGGSNMNDLLHYSDRIILKYKPRAVAIYEGDNDISQKISPQQIKDKFLELKEKLEKANKDIRIYIISVKPSVKRWSMWPQMSKTNSIMKEICESSDNCYFIDTAAALLKDGKPRDNIFIKDNLHLNQNGYDLWANAVKKVLLPVEMPKETK